MSAAAGGERCEQLRLIELVVTHLVTERTKQSVCRLAAATAALGGHLAGEVDVVLQRDRDPEQRSALAGASRSSASSASASARSARTE